MLNGKSILVTGGTGSFGRKFIEHTLAAYPDIKRVVVFSRDEMKQFEMAQAYPSERFPKLEFVIGDIRDYHRLSDASRDIDVIIHTAAMKHVHLAEYNPMEAIKTNVLGSENLINAAIKNHVQDVVALSTDKAAAPINLYGATKLCADKLFVAANNMRSINGLKFSVVRYGNVIGSRGSVVPLFLKQRAEGRLKITHEDMSRFHITPDSGIQTVFHALEHAWGGEIYVPKCPSFKLTDLAEAIAPGEGYEVIGIRPGEKLYEEMITGSDAISTVEFDDYFVILPSLPKWSTDEFVAHFNGRRVGMGFSYSSETNPDWLSVEQLRADIRKYVDAGFEVG